MHLKTASTIFIFAFLQVFFPSHLCNGSKLLLTIDTTVPIQMLHPLSPSVAMGVSVIEDRWIDYFKDSKFMNLAKGLSPAFLRMGGTNQDFTHYVLDKVEYQSRAVSKNVVRTGKRINQCRPAKRNETAFQEHVAWLREQRIIFEEKQRNGVRSAQRTIDLTGSDWETLNEFCECVGWNFIFGLNLLTRSGSEWNSSNAEQLLNFTENRYHVNWELGNEPNFYYHTAGVRLTPEQVGDGFLNLQKLLEGSSWWNSSLILGPDANDIGATKAGTFLNRFLNRAGKVIDGLTFHHYYLNGKIATEKDFLNHKVMNTITKPLDQMKGLVNSSSRGQPLWLGETASTYGGGAPGLSDRFINGFLWLDKLGMTSRYGIEMVVRQSFVQSNYELVNLVDNQLDPLPDYWLTYIFKKLVGHEVLGVELQKCAISKCYPIDSLINGNFRAYAHCAKSNQATYPKGAIVVYFINLKNHSTRLAIKPFHSLTLKVDLYLLQPSVSGDLLSNGTLLNGKLLRLTNDGELPPIYPRRLQPTAASKGIFIPSHSFGFFVLKNANAKACYKD